MRIVLNFVPKIINPKLDFVIKKSKERSSDTFEKVFFVILHINDFE